MAKQNVKAGDPLPIIAATSASLTINSRYDYSTGSTEKNKTYTYVTPAIGGIVGNDAGESIGESSWYGAIPDGYTSAGHWANAVARGLASLSTYTFLGASLGFSVDVSQYE